MGNTTWRILKGVVARTLYAGHAALAIYRVFRETGNAYYFALTTSIALLLVEGVITLYFRDGRDLGWFSPSVFIYLCGLVPSVWILELSAADSAQNLTLQCLAAQQSAQSQPQSSGFQQLYSALQQKENWLLAVEQGTLFILIIGRWLAPLGKLSRNQRSQLLLIYIGTAADIIELFETFKEPIVRSNRLLVMVIMAAWSWSLLQYTVVYVSFKSNTKGSRVHVRPDEMGSNNSVRRTRSEDASAIGCCHPEIVTPLTALIMQDCPFLALRFYLLYLGVMSPMLLFFTAKNILILLLQMYRLIIVCNDSEEVRASTWANDGKREEISLEIVD
ncbi:uncharacterized protein TRIADDRAFT_57528 [Trichoplax adhaerens]|uniref:Transmembrane protein 26 n=1 Tax=Trichoplax adhaerens TaxID=10228 RepID=B3RZP4_TRIAD|nr:hypothetical protein TRIADDRAFT_57528 [Trichoplax adhaerens]EDV24240.1 hypothetical protein TRIADDRAFT_57528 [Trichoplax adhaerens]|eukprot:XP_002113766.1 hypothetical protein TRIADDRAFT_57528 [Trichoplax adhaerens]